MVVLHSQPVVLALVVAWVAVIGLGQAGDMLQSLTRMAT